MVLTVRMLAASQGDQDSQSLPFQTAVITRGDVEIVVSSTGTLAAVGTVEVGTQVSGTINRVLADYNDKVIKGQILAELDTALFQASVTQSRASLAQAKAKLKQARAEYDRNLPLFQQGHLSAQEFLTYETERDTARASVLSAQADLDKALTNLEYACIRSPIEGTVIERSIEEGQTVAASYSTPTLFYIAEDLSRMQIEADVDESDIGQIRNGQKVRFTVQAYPDEVFTGVVSQIRLNPAVVSNVVTYTVVVDASNEKGLLLSGMTADMDFLAASAKDVLLVPNSAIAFAAKRPAASGDEGPVVLVIDEGQRPRPVFVETGVNDGTVAELKAGDVSEGDMVAVGVKKDSEKSKSNLLSRILPKPPQGRGGRPGPGGPGGGM